MDYFTILIAILALIVLLGAACTIIGYLRFWEQKQRLPEACSYLGLKEKNETLMQENSKLEKENESLGLVVEESQRKKAWLQENQPLLLTLEADRKKQEVLKAEYENYLDQLSNLIPQVQDKTDEFNTLSNKVSVAQNDLELHNNKLDSMRQEKADLEARNASLLKENETKAIENEAAVRKLQNLQDDLKSGQENLTKITEEYQNIQLHVKTLQAENSVAQKNKDELELKAEKLNTALDSMRQEKADLEARNASLLKENETQAIENEAAVRKLRELQELVGVESDKLANITAEYTEKKLELDSYQTQKDALLREIDILKESLEALRKESGIKGANSEETLKDLWEPIVFPNLIPPKKSKSEQDFLAETKNYIRGRKLYFPDRVLHAFHTSMKCNDISPITVLAGISGTGKSELPKCYAEGMGMHFSMLAVQPRWDSPQDLLGFYNYMENKYKATELARALVRFDRYNRSSWGIIPKECDDRSDRMLLVLLDEMNLARVEYYFSEFLSKLETRRGVDCQDPASRAKAEIELELTGRAPLRIFPDRNILFTGTMNEDESTQTLSDKVLDRANVLRFGKPLSANITERLQNYKEMPPRKEGLTRDQWHSWCTDAKNVKVDDTVYEWINDLNDAMEELQKPFGHRVVQAISTYIANYPQGVSNGDEKELAFADQIEQRIMPKLRGVDLTLYEEPLEKIGKLIQKTGDQKLHEAYKKGLRDTSNGIFLWQGVDRSEEI